MRADDDVLSVARVRLLAEADAVRAVADALDDGFVRTASLVLSCTGKLFVGGSGTSGAVARRMAHILAVTGTPAIAFSPMDSLHGASGAITDADLVLLISKGGASDEVIQTARVAQQRGARVIALTRAHDTPLARIAQHSVVVDVDPRAELGGVIATGITMAQAAWGDALAEVLMRGRGYTWASFISTHPAGAVGRIEDLPEDLPMLEIPPFDSVELIP
ncbi:MAG: SIS domain-containing protein [Microbacterium sp.]